MSPAATLAAQLRALSVRACEQSSPVHLSQLMAEGFGVLADSIDEAVAAAESVFASIAALSQDEQAAAVRAFMAGAAGEFPPTAGADQAQPGPAVTADQVIDAGPRGLELASALHGLSAEEFEQAVTNARAILFGQVAG